MLLTKNNTASVCPVFESAAGAILYGGIMKLKSHTSDSSFSWIKDSISVSVSDLSSAEIILKFSDFSVTAFLLSVSLHMILKQKKKFPFLLSSLVLILSG